MKTCSRCKVEKEITEFHIKKNSKLESSCKDCHRKYVNDHYRNNKKYYKDKANKNNQKIREWFLEYKLKQSCKCGENHPATLDFHHRDPSVKTECISVLASNGGSLKNLQSELEKCDVICSNCHRKLHWQVT